MKKKDVYLGLYLRKERIMSGLSQQAVADLAGCHVQFVSNWERGCCKPPPAEFKKLRAILKIKKSEVAAAMMADEKQQHIDFLKVIFK